MKAAVTVKKNHEFRRIYRRGASAVTPCLVMYCRRNPTGASRLGITVSTKVGKAVVRNLVRRRLREIYRLDPPKPGYDVILVARKRAAFVSYQKLARAYRELSEKLGLSREEAQ